MPRCRGGIRSLSLGYWMVIVFFFQWMKYRRVIPIPIAMERANPEEGEQGVLGFVVGQAGGDAQEGGPDV